MPKVDERVIHWISHVQIEAFSYLLTHVDSEEKAEKILLENEIEIIITLGDGASTAEAYGCDLTYDYVKINGDYRT